VVASTIGFWPSPVIKGIQTLSASGDLKDKAKGKDEIKTMITDIPQSFFILATPLAERYKPIHAHKKGDWSKRHSATVHKAKDIDWPHHPVINNAIY
jgi:hypothetical protein